MPITMCKLRSRANGLACPVPAMSIALPCLVLTSITSAPIDNAVAPCVASNLMGMCLGMQHGRIQVMSVLQDEDCSFVVEFMTALSVQKFKRRA